MKKRNKILLWILGTILFIILSGYAALFHLGLMEYLVNRELRNTIKGNLPLKVFIGDIYGDYFSDLHVSNIFVYYEDSTITYNTVFIPHLEFAYSLSEFYKGELNLRKLVIDSAIVKIKKDPTRGWLIPRGKGGEKKKPFKLFDFEVNQIAVNNLKVLIDKYTDTINFSDIDLSAKVQVYENTYSAVIDSLVCRSNDARFNIETEGGSFTLNKNEFLFQDLDIMTDSSKANLTGHFSLGDTMIFRLSLESPNINMSELSSYIKANLRGNLAASGDIVYREGRFDFSLNIGGNFMDRMFDSVFADFEFYKNVLTFDTITGHIFDGCGIDGHGWMNVGNKPATYFFNGSLEHFNLDNLAFNTFETNLSGRANINGVGLRSNTLALNIDADLDESWFDEYHGYKAFGSMFITTDSLILKDEFAVKYKNDDFIVTGKIDYSGPIFINALGNLNDLSDFNGQTFIDEMGGRGTLKLQATGNIKDPDIIGSFTSDSLWLYDVFSDEAYIIYDIDRFFYNRDGQVSVYLLNGDAYSLPFDSIYLDMHVDSQYAVIDSSAFYNEFVRGTTFGILDYYNYPSLLTLDSLLFHVLEIPIENDNPIEIAIDSTGYDIIQGRLVPQAGYVKGVGRINFDETMSTTIEGDGIEITTWVDLYDSTLDLSGLLSGDIKLDGTFMKPLIELKGVIDSLKSNEFIPEGPIKAQIYADYYDNYFHIDSIIATRKDEGYYRIEGTFPTDLAFSSEVIDRFPNVEQEVYFNARDQRLDLISGLLEDVDDFTGDFLANVKLYGTPHEPKLDGKARVRDGNLKLFELINPLTDVSCYITMNDNTIHIDSASAKTTIDKWNNPQGQLVGKGSVTVHNIDEFEYDVELKLTDFPVNYELGDAQVLANADLTIIGTTPPTVYGDAEIISAQYRENFATEDEGWLLLSTLDAEDSWNYNINVKIPANLWIKNDDIDAEFSGNIDVIREGGRYRFVGELEILRGKGFWVDKTFRITPGSMIYYEDIETPNPRLDILATTKIRTSVYNASLDKYEFTNEDLCVHVTGTLEEPIISACDDSPFSTEDILGMLFMNYAKSDSSNARTADLVGERLTAGISGIVSTSLGKIGSRTLGVETFEIDPVYGDKFDPLGTRLTLGLYTLPNLYIYGRSDIAGQSGQELGFEYRLKRFLLMEGRVDEDNLYRLFFNLTWDY